MPKIPPSSRLSKIQTFIQSVGAKSNPTNPKHQKIKKPSPKTRLKKANYFFGFLKSQCRSTDNEKLTIVPSTANKAVLSKSSEFKFGTMLKKEPLKVLTYI